MAALVSDDFELYYVSGGDTTLGLRGPEALRAEMTEYFRGLPDVRSEALDTLVSGSFVAFRERVRWPGNGAEKTQSSLAVYEVREGSIRRVWYYPAEP